MSAVHLGAEHACFQVEELPLYPASGQGEHRYYLIEKDGLTTDAAVALLAKAHGLRPRVVGWAGRKDRHAITRQWLSVHDPGMRHPLDPSRLDGRLRILAEERHHNKLRPGHLRGNRFRLGLVAETEDETALAAILADLHQRGIRNAFGGQRYGLRGATLRAARAVAASDPAAALACLIDPSGIWAWGDPLPDRRATGLEGDLYRAVRERPSDPEAALHAAGRRLFQLLVSAAQSAVFDAVLVAREEAGLLNHCLAGDVLLRGRLGERCDDPEAGQAALEAGEVLCTGPLPGARMVAPGAEVLAQERAWSASCELPWDHFASRGPLAAPGSRRALLIRFLEAPTLERHDDYLWLTCCLPAGCFATTVLEACGVTLPPTRRSDREESEPS